jgi:AcrR family transcriptional regulator
VPKIVDHDERRRQLAQATLRVIGRAGLGSATTRAVAEESGWSTGVLKHYYADKNELLDESLRELERLNLERFEIAGREQTGFEAMRESVAAILRGDAAETRSWIAFTARASIDPHTAATMRRAIEVWVARWADLVRRGQLDGSIRNDIDADRVAIELHAVVNGLRIRELFQPTGPTRRWKVLDDHLLFIAGLRAL